MTVKWIELAKMPITSRPHSQSWWNEQCRIHRDAYNATRNPDDLKLYNSVTKKVRNAFFDDKLREMSANKKPWEGVRWTRPRPPPSFTTIITDNRNVASTEELFDVMHAQFSKASAWHLDLDAATALIDATPQFDNREFLPISAAEVREALNDTSDSSSPGPDKITWRILKKATWVNGAIEGLASLYNCSVESGTWPNWFKSSECVIIPKPNKPNYTVPKAYRPISLLNTVGKLLTKIVANRMQFDAAAHGLLHPGQCRGIRKHATIDVGIVLTSFITNAKEAGLHTTACTFDISQFFPSLDHRVTALILTRLGFDDKLVTLLGSYFRDWTTFYRWDSATSKSYDFSVGTPQGDCISLVLSALYLSIALKVSVPIPFPPPNVRSLFFVDDGLLYAASRSLKQNASRIERKLQEVTAALACIGLYIEADKTEVIHFPGYVLEGSGRRHAEILNKPPITVNDGNSTFVVKPKDCIRYLGFYFSSTLDWNAHICFYFNRAFSTIHAFKMLGSSICGLDTLQRRNAYQACVLSVLTYGLPLWYAPDGKGVSRHTRLIAKVHSYATRWITGAFHTTPNGAKEMIAGLPPLITILNQCFHGYRARIVTLPPSHILVATMNNKWTNPAYSHVSPKNRPSHLPSNDPFKRLRTHLVHEQFEFFADVQQPGRRCVDLFPERVVVNTSSPKKASKSFKAWVENLKTETQSLHSSQDLVVYTDGAYHHNDNRASYAVCTIRHSTWNDLTDWCPAASSFDSEVRAMEKAIEIITSSRAQRAHLFCNNKAAANAIFNFEVKSSQMSILRINHLLSDWLATNSDNELHIRFAPGHSGIEGNERADALTKTGLKECPMQPPTILRSHFINSYKREQSDTWTRLFKDRTYRGSQWFPVRRKKKIFKPSGAKAARNFFHNMAHGDASRLSRISYVMTNHAPTGEYRLRFFPDQPAHCPHCGEETLLSRRHVLCECPRYVDKFSSLTDWGSQRHNDKTLSGFLDKNPTAFSFGELPRDVH